MDSVGEDGQQYRRTQPGKNIRRLVATGGEDRGDDAPFFRLAGGGAPGDSGQPEQAQAQSQYKTK